MEKTMEKLVKEAQIEARMQGLPIDQIGEFVADYIKNQAEVKKETPDTRTKNASEVIKGSKVAFWYFCIASTEEKKELHDAYIAYCKSLDDNAKGQSALFDELAKLLERDNEARDETNFQRAIENLKNRWHGWYCTKTQYADGVYYAEYEDGSYVKFDNDKAVIFMKGDEESPSELYEYDNRDGIFAWKKDKEYVNDAKMIDSLNDKLFTVRHSVALYPHGKYNTMDWIVDWVYNHVIFKSLNAIAKGDGEFDRGDSGDCWLYKGFGCYTKDVDFESVFDDDEGEWVKGEHVNTEFVDFERPYHKGEWKAVLNYKYHVEVTEEMTALLNKISDIHSK